MQLRLKTGRRSQVWLPSFSRSDAALGLTETESCLKAARAVRSGFLGWDQAFPPPQPKPSWLSGQSGEPDLIVLDLLLGISNTLENPVSFRSGYLRVISHLGSSLSYGRQCSSQVRGQSPRRPISLSES